MSGYRRPAIPNQEFRDAAGHVIHYGSQWGEAGPAESAYSVDSHPERFAPLHEVADAIISDLMLRHDVERDDDPDVGGDLLRPFADVVRAVRLTPAAPDAAPLTFVFTSYPGLAIHAGLLTDFSYPVCGCDACDETWESTADELEWQAFAVTRGLFRETVAQGRSPGVGFSLAAADGSSRMAGEHGAADVPANRLAAAADQLRGLPDAWRPWPLRH